MADPSPGLLKSVELRLLRCTLSQGRLPSPQTPTPQPPNLLHSHISTLLDSIERGDYAAALSSPAAGLVFGFAASWEFENSVDSAARFYSQVERSAEDFLRGTRSSEAWLRVLDSDGDDDLESEIELRFAILMCLGVAALLAFTQQNVTGPTGNFSPFPLLFPRAEEDGASDGGEWDMWARHQLTSVGCDLLGKFSLLQYIVYAKILLSKTKDLSKEETNSCLSGTRSISWWLCRLILLQQRILDELSSSLYDLLQVLKNETLLQFGELDNVIKYWGPILHKGEASTVVSMAQLEAGILEYKYGRVDSSRFHLNCAEEACGMHLSVTGVLGFRTIHQVEAKSQLVLVANTDHHINGGGRPKESPQGQTENSACEEKRTLPDCSDILMTPKLVTVNDSGCNGNFMDVGKDTPLSAAQQAVVLAQCLHLKRRSRDDELSRWEMAPYIEAVDAQHESYYIIRSFCDILRIRWESTRSRTKQRALLMMDKLVEAVYEVFPLAAQRIQFSYGVHVPTIPALRKEYAELLVSCGMVGEALKIFEDLELWDNLIYCYSLLDKKAAAVDLIKARLSVMPNDPRLWCSLGDVTNTDTYYEKALEVSNDRSARAKRSLARSSYNRGEYVISKNLWESAMALNSLFPDGWFALGAAALKARDIDKALDGFTRAVQLDPENGEAWNNVACLHMVKKKSKPAFIAFKEALKFRRNSWQLWQNYSHVALDVGSFGQALEATKKVLDLSNNKQVDVELLDKVMTVVEERSSMSANPSNFSEVRDICTSQIDSSHSLTNSSVDSGSSEHLIVEPRENELLLDMLGNILGQVVRCAAGADIWGLYARWHKLKGNLIMCSEALLKQVRSYQGSDLWHDRDRFKKFAHASLQLCNIYMEIASSTRSRRELTAAEMHLRNSVKQAVNFADTEEYQNLQACLEEVQKRLNDTSDEGAQLQ